MMLSVFAHTDHLPAVRAAIATEPRLDELVVVQDQSPAGAHLLVDERGIGCPLDWFNDLPPYLLPMPMAFSPGHLLGLVMVRLGNYARAYELLAGSPELLAEVDLLNRLQHGAELPPDLEEGWREGGEGLPAFRAAHNRAVLGHYGVWAEAPALAPVKQSYEQALRLAPNDELRAFSARHYASLLLDNGELAAAGALLDRAIAYALSDEAKFTLMDVQYHAWLAQLTVPYDEALMDRVKNTLWQVLQFYEKQGKTVQVGLLLTDAAQVANMAQSFAESLGYINRAVQIFGQEEVPELLGNALLRKGTLLYTWAQNGQPQFYRPAMEAYQEALKVFTKEVAPDIFADIHHNLGVIYSEIPDEIKKKSIWASLSTTSFREALKYYTKAEFPYEYAMICNSYGNAFTKYPPAVKSDNFARALEQYDEALRIRTAAELPYERAITLLNYLEAAWFVSQGDDQLDPAFYAGLVAKAQEVKHLVTDPALLAEADRHLAKLAEAEQAVAGQS
jgi:tetratricopeptide (TPR) repeat protein